MKHFLIGLSVISLSALTACGHYSDDLAALDSHLMKASPASATADLNQIETAAGPMAAPAPMSLTDQLARDYYQMARYENDEAMDYQSARLYTEKAKAAMAGRISPPRNASRTQISNEAIFRDLTLARAELISVLKTQRSPQNDPYIARAIVSYDCWVDQAEEAKLGDDATCQAQFEEAMMALEGVNADQMRYAISFMPGQTALATGAKDTIGKVLQALQGTTPDTARLSFADNGDNLGAQRSAALRSVLQFNGIDPAYFDSAPQPISADPVSTQPDTVQIIIQKITPATTQRQEGSNI